MAKVGNLASRVLVAVFAIPILLFVIYQDHAVYMWAISFAATLLALGEFFSMTLPDVESPAASGAGNGEPLSNHGGDHRGDQAGSRDRRASLICGAIAAAGLYWLDPFVLTTWAGNVRFAAFVPAAIILLSVVPIGIYYLFWFRDMDTAARRLAYSVTGIVYVGLLITFVPLIKRDFGPAGGDVLVFVLAVTWWGDTGAYFAGRYLGRAKLYPSVSPKKTWAGAIGGLLNSALCGIAVKYILMAVHGGDSLMSRLSIGDILLMAVPGAILGQLGDLLESLIKRSTGVKDSGALLPGHGGILDRVDAVLLMAPYIYMYLLIRGTL